MNYRRGSIERIYITCRKKGRNFQVFCAVQEFRGSEGTIGVVPTAQQLSSSSVHFKVLSGVDMCVCVGFSVGKMSLRMLRGDLNLPKAPTWFGYVYACLCIYKYVC